jgi:hypothetical protein
MRRVLEALLACSVAAAILLAAVAVRLYAGWPAFS